MAKIGDKLLIFIENIYVSEVNDQEKIFIALILKKEVKAQQRRL